MGSRLLMSLDSRYSVKLLVPWVVSLSADAGESTVHIQLCTGPFFGVNFEEMTDQEIHSSRNCCILLA